MMRKFMAVAMDPVEAGERVLEGIRRNDLYILTHQEFEQPARERMEALLASFPSGKAPAARSMTPTVHDRHVRSRARPAAVMAQGMRDGHGRRLGPARVFWTSNCPG
jgi:hypothetical protein